jgi:hypothetical protein
VYNISIRNPFATLEDLRKTLSIDFFGERTGKRELQRMMTDVHSFA